MTDYTAEDRLHLARRAQAEAAQLLALDVDALALVSGNRLAQLAGNAADAVTLATTLGLAHGIPAVEESAVALVAREIHTTEGSTLTPWSDGWSVGFRAHRPDGAQEFVYLNPSIGSTDLADAGLATVFLYAGDPGPDGDPATLDACSHITLLPALTSPDDEPAGGVIVVPPNRGEEVGAALIALSEQYAAEANPDHGQEA